MIEQEVLVEEAGVSDAPGLARLLEQVAQETEFLTRDDDSQVMTEAEVAHFIQQKASSLNEICLLAKVGDQVAGVLNVASNKHTRTDHIGDIFIAVSKAYWGYGLGNFLLEALVDWAKHSGTIRRLELTVQARNERAVHLYQKYGFEIEGVKVRGAKTKTGDFLDVLMMAKMIDGIET